MLPTKDKDAFIYGHPNGFDINRKGNRTKTNDKWNYQHVYLVSDRDIERTDNYWCPYFGHIYGCDIRGPFEKKTSKKIEACTDPSLGLPPIPQSFIEEWVKKHGKIKEVYIQATSAGYPTINNEFNGEVIILPTNDSWDKQDLKKELNNAYNEGMRVGMKFMATLEIPNKLFNEWFDTNY